MRNFILMFAFLLLATASHSQKVKMKNDVASVDGEPFLKFTTITFGSDYAIRHVDSDVDEISILYLSYKDPNQATSGNPDGKVSWIEVSFLTFNLKCEVDNRTRKAFTKLVYVSQLYVDGKLNEENVQKFVNKYGTRFSDNRPNGNTTIIINN